MAYAPHVTQIMQKTGYNPRRPLDYGDLGGVRQAPILQRPIVGQRAIMRAAQWVAEKQEADERRRNEWKQHVWRENLAQQTLSLDQGAAQAHRNAAYARELEGELTRTLTQLANTTTKLAQTEDDLLRERHAAAVAAAAPARRPRPASAHVRSSSHRSALETGATASASSFGSFLSQQQQQQRPPSRPRGARQPKRPPPMPEQHPQFGEAPIDVDEQHPPVFVPHASDPCPTPAFRWAADAPAGLSDSHRRAPPVPKKLVRQLMPEDLHSGNGARNCLAPPEGWDGPYRASRPAGPIRPWEYVVGLTGKHDPKTAPLRRALEAQYRRASTKHAHIWAPRGSGRTLGL